MNKNPESLPDKNNMGSIMLQPGVVAQAPAALLELHCLIQAWHLPLTLLVFLFICMVLSSQKRIYILIAQPNIIMLIKLAQGKPAFLDVLRVCACR